LDFGEFSMLLFGDFCAVLILDVELLDFGESEVHDNVAPLLLLTLVKELELVLPVLGTRSVVVVGVDFPHKKLAGTRVVTVSRVKSFSPVCDETFEELFCLRFMVLLGDAWLGDSGGITLVGDLTVGEVLLCEISSYLDTLFRNSMSSVLSATDVFGEFDFGTFS
jgi:hypothetical protein